MKLMPSAYDQAVTKFKVNYLFRAVIDAGGNMGAAARAVGVHRNTLTRVLGDAGYPSTYIMKLIKKHKTTGMHLAAAKPLTIEPAMKRSA